MGQAKLRAKEIEQLKTQNPNKQMGDDLNNYFYSLGDGDDVSRHRIDIIKGLIQSTIKVPENLNHLIKNANKAKTSSQTGFGFSLGTLYKKFNELHIGPFSGCSTETMLKTFEEFLTDDGAELQPCISFEDGKISQGWGWVGKNGTLSIKWFKPEGQTLTMIGVVDNSTLSYKDLSREQAFA